MSKRETVTVPIGQIEMRHAHDGKIVELIEALQGILETVPDEFKDSATVNFSAYDWEGIYCEYDRLITEAEIQARLDEIDRQRASAARALQSREVESWIRNIRLGAGIMDRGEALAFLQTNPDANNYHPDVYRTGRHGHA